jgi:ATP-dependent RNA helicase SUPV3L1/SUV3
MLERLADLIRPLLGWRGGNGATPPKGATGDGGFTAIPEMMSLLGCSPDELSGVLKALGFRLDRRPIKPSVTAPASPEAPPAAEGEAPTAEAVTSEVVPAPKATPTQEAATVAAGAVAAPEGAAAATPAEPKFEDVWRPRRHARGERSERGQRNRQRGGGHRTPANAPTAQPAAAAATPVPEAATPDPAPAPREAKGHPSKDRRPHNKDRGERGDRGRDAGQHRRGQQGDPRRRDDRRDDRRKAEVHAAAPPRRGGIDPDSPFAALGALRDELAKRGKESST